MKRFLCFVLALCLAISVSAQKGSIQKKIAHSINNIDLPVVVGENPGNTYVSNKSLLDDPVSSITKYDLQTNGAIESRVYLFPDGTVGTAATWSAQETSWTDRGTGYNLFDGTAFGALPTSRVETIRTGWPSYNPWGADGELIICHQATGNLVMNTRTTKGSGTWTQSILPNALPTGVPAMLWPRSVTNGTNHMNIHVIALTEPTANGGIVYNGMDGAIMYCKSTDGGVTFSAWTQPVGLTSSAYFGFGGDSYAFAEPHGDTIAYTIGGDNRDLILMKSVDNGTTWTKTIIWHCLYSLSGTSPNFYNACDGSQAVALDKHGFAHVACGYNNDSTYGAAGHYYNRNFHDIIYWNEHMAQLPQLLYKPDLIANGQIGAWLKDSVNVLAIPLANLTITGGSLTRYPQIVIDNRDKIYIVYSAATTLVDANSNNLHHIFGRDGTISGDGVVWSNDTLVDITGDWLQYGFSECIFGACAPSSDNYVYTFFQKDDYAGSYVQSVGQSSWVGQTSASDNSEVLLQWLKPINIGINDKKDKPTFNVGQNYPNPVTGLTKVNVYMQNGGDLSFKLTNLTGQTLMTMEKSNVQAGVNEFVIDGSQLPSGVYFYTVKQGDKSITKKMIVQ
ncbi:MAG: T9SS type A sorting domain-containing protein [Bacteroidetes bacterium]|nr:T9SS type A sorting domain-containing protein [Bacteroidota bacterium]